MHNDTHPYERRLRLRLRLPWFLIRLGIARKGMACELVDAEHKWYNIDNDNLGCYDCRKIKTIDSK